MSIYNYSGEEICTSNQTIIKTSTDIIPNNDINKYFVLIVDDVTSNALTIADRLVENSIYPVFALKMESMDKEINWEDVRKLQNDYGFEICFHGMSHSHTSAGTAPDNDDVMMEDIKLFLELAKANGINIYGYAGPNHYQMPVGARNIFFWARSAYGSDLTTYGAGNRFATTFSNVIVWSCDPAGGALDVETMKNEATKLEDNQYLTPMCHTQQLIDYIDDYMEVFDEWKNVYGMKSLTGIQAVKQSMYSQGSVGNNNLFEIQAGIATNPYHLIAGNGTVLSKVVE